MFYTLYVKEEERWNIKLVYVCMYKNILTSSDSERSMLPLSSSSSCSCSDLMASIPRRSCSAHSTSSAGHAPSADPLMWPDPPKIKTQTIKQTIYEETEYQQCTEFFF